MLNAGIDTKYLAEHVRRYLLETLGVPAEISPWSADKKAPYYLQDAFEFCELELLNQRILLAIDYGRKSRPAATVRDQTNALTKLAGLPVAYVTKALASYERKRLVQQKVPFIVPGNQLYLPGLGIDLREYFRTRDTGLDTAFSPSTQAMLIAALLRKPWEAAWRPTQAAETLGYTVMTASRAVKELTDAGVAERRGTSKRMSVYLGDHPSELWERAKPFLRSPVKRTVWADPISALELDQAPVAGLSALAQDTMLAEPKWPVRAMGTREWHAAVRRGFETLPEPVDGTYEWQIWTYDPKLGGARKVVDPLSLTLSLERESDERIQRAIEDLKEQLPW